MNPRLTLLQLTKRFGGVAALSDVSLTVEPGQRIALLGHNGAGKSTMMKIILGLIGFDSGSVSVAGAAPGSRAARQATAYLPENVAFHPALTGAETVRHYLRLRGHDPRKAEELLERVDLAQAMHRRIGTYSKGMRQRVGLAQALIGQPALMVLDEPTSGLDPVSRRGFYALLDDLATQGTAILLSSHALTEVEARTDRIAILSRGVLVAEGSIAELRRRADLPVTVTITPRDAGTVRAGLPQAVVNGRMLTLSVAQTDKLTTLGRIAQLGAAVEDVDIAPPSLEDIYTHFSRPAESEAA